MNHPLSIVRRGTVIALGLGMLFPFHLQAAVINPVTEPTDPAATAGYIINVSLDKTQYLTTACETPVISVTVTDSDTGQPVVGAYVEFILNSLDNPQNRDFFWDSLPTIGYLRTDANGFASTPTKAICTTGNGRSYAVIFPPSGPNNNGTTAGGTYFSVVAGPPGPGPGGSGSSCREQYYDLARHCPYLDYVY